MSMIVIQFAASVLCAAIGLTTLRLFWRLVRHPSQEGRRRYPTFRHVVRGSAPGRSGRTGWMLYNGRKNRIDVR